MTERQLQFRVGLFVLAAALALAAMVFKFSDLKDLWEPKYSLTIHFDTAPGVFPQTPVRLNGIAIGAVREVDFDEDHGGVVAVVDIRRSVRLRADAEPRLMRSLLGDARIEFTTGRSRELLQPGSRLEGIPASDPLQAIDRVEQRLTVTLEAFEATSREWQQVGRNFNSLVETNRGNLDLVVERAADSLHQFTETMQTFHESLANANAIVGDPQNQEHLRQTLAAMPEMILETRDAIAAVRTAVTTADANLKNLEQVTGPLADHSRSIVSKLDGTMTNLESLSGELDQFARIVARGDGTLRQFVANPGLYENLNRSASSLAVLLKALEPTLADLRVLSDKLARHPELLGVGGAFRPSSGIKEPSPFDEPFR
ncbi:MAG TPA: MlaD family protein [Planctomycetaceae bacterium]|nr:MlaD family protein [Planctomycetaceae bacterium]